MLELKPVSIEAYDYYNLDTATEQMLAPGDLNSDLAPDIVMLPIELAADEEVLVMARVVRAQLGVMAEGNKAFAQLAARMRVAPAPQPLESKNSTTTQASTTPVAEECLMCAQVVPECRRDCASCNVVQQTCKRCAHAVCADDIIPEPTAPVAPQPGPPQAGARCTNGSPDYVNTILHCGKPFDEMRCACDEQSLTWMCVAAMPAPCIVATTAPPATTDAPAPPLCADHPGGLASPQGRPYTCKQLAALHACSHVRRLGLAVFHRF